MISLSAQSDHPDCVEKFEVVIQDAARDLHSLQAGITDVRICHPVCGRVVFIITFLSQRDMEFFKNGFQQQLHRALAKYTITNYNQGVRSREVEEEHICKGKHLWIRYPFRPPRF